MTTLETAKFLEDLTGKHARLYTAAIEDMLIAMARGNKVALSDARKRLDKIITETIGTAEVLGASITLRAAAGQIGESAAQPIARAEAFRDVCGSAPWSKSSVATRAAVGELLTFAATPTQTILPRVTFLEALEDMVTRTPVTIRAAAERTAQAISKLYGEGRMVAFVRSAEQAVTERVQALIAEAIREGTEELGAGRLIKMGVDEIRTRTAAWTEGYARMAFRTNVNTAVTAGRFRQAQDQDIKAVLPAFEFNAVGPPVSAGGDTRNNHWAANGLIFKVDNVVWNRIAPPLGFSCRCSVRQVGLPELRRMGRVGGDGSIREDRLPAGAHADAGFRHGGRPDLLLNQVTG